MSGKTKQLEQTSIQSFFSQPGKPLIPLKTSSDSPAKEESLDKKKRYVIDSDDDVESQKENTDSSIKSMDEVKMKSKKPKKQRKIDEMDQDIKVEEDIKMEKEEEEYDDDKGPWKKGQDIPYSALCDTFEKIETTTKRLLILDYLVDFFKTVIRLSPNCFREVVYLCINRLGPEFQGSELGLGESILMKAVAEATGRTANQMKSEVEELGDLGLVAQRSKSNQPTLFKPKPLTILTVFKTLQEISELTGGGSQQKKIDKIKKMLAASEGNQPKYLVRSLEGKLRISLAGQTVLIAVAHASLLTHPKTKKYSKIDREVKLDEAVEIIKQVYSEIPSYDLIIPKLLEVGIFELPKYCYLTPGIPLRPMLAHPTKSIEEIFKRFENIQFTCEYKYDGERAQIHHLENGQGMIFSRNLETLSEKYPDIIERIPKFTKEKNISYVIDCEAVGWDPEKKTILPFQILSTRKRKDVTIESVKIQVCVYVFDLLYLNGKSLIKETFRTRRELLQKHFQEIEGEFKFAEHEEFDNVESIEHYMNQSIEDNCEGLMVKTLDKDSSYEPSKRSRNWLKVKKDYISDGIGDTLDLVVIGAYKGRGRRTGKYGGYLLACYDPDTEEYQAMCKLGTGFSDANLADYNEFFQSHIISKPPIYYKYCEKETPDVWFEPVQVWEIKCADFTISPVYVAAMGLVFENKGISLRFPRFVKIRDDKKPEDATTNEQIAEMYQNQKIVANNNNLNKSENVDDDFDY